MRSRSIETTRTHPSSRLCSLSSGTLRGSGVHCRITLSCITGLVSTSGMNICRSCDTGKVTTASHRVHYENQNVAVARYGLSEHVHGRYPRVPSVECDDEPIYAPPVPPLTAPRPSNAPRTTLIPPRLMAGPGPVPQARIHAPAAAPQPQLLQALAASGSSNVQGKLPTGRHRDTCAIMHDNVRGDEGADPQRVQISFWYGFSIIPHAHLSSSADLRLGKCAQDRSLGNGMHRRTLCASWRAPMRARGFAEISSHGRAAAVKGQARAARGACISPRLGSEG